MSEPEHSWSYTLMPYGSALHAKVCSADLRVKQLRDEVPAALTKAIQDHLVACRPAALEAALTSAGAAKPTGGWNGHCDGAVAVLD